MLAAAQIAILICHYIQTVSSRAGQTLVAQCVSSLAKMCLLPMLSPFVVVIHRLVHSADQQRPDIGCCVLQALAKMFAVTAGGMPPT